MTIRDLRQRNAADKAAGQCRGDIGVYIDGSRLIVDVAVVDATYVPHPHNTAPPPDEPQDPQSDEPNARGATQRSRKRR